MINDLTLWASVLSNLDTFLCITRISRGKKFIAYHILYKILCLVTIVYHIIILLVIQLYFNTIKSGMAVPFTGMCVHDNSKQINIMTISLLILIKL